MTETLKKGEEPNLNINLAEEATKIAYREFPEGCQCPRLRDVFRPCDWCCFRNEVLAGRYTKP